MVEKALRLFYLEFESLAQKYPYVLQRKVAHWKELNLVALFLSSAIHSKFLDNNLVGVCVITKHNEKIASISFQPV